MIGDHDYVVTGELTIRGVTRPVPLRVRYLGQWQTPWWEEKDGEWIDKGPKVRAGFVATTEINRHDFGVSWNDTMDKGPMNTVGIRELKANLSRYLKRVRSGARLVVTERGRAIASIQPVEARTEVGWAHALVAAGRAQWSGGKPEGATPPVPVKRGKSVSEAVLEDRR